MISEELSHLFREIISWCGCKPREAVANIPSLIEDYVENNSSSRYLLGTYVVDIDDKDLSDLAVVVYDHMIHGFDLYSIRRLSNNHLSTGTHDDLKAIPTDEAVKHWCRDSIEY